MEDHEIIRQYYDQNPQLEWDRLEREGRLRPEFALSSRMLEQYIRPGDRVLDLGGGPGRYSLHLAQMGVQVTLADLSPGNVTFAREKAREHGLKLEAMALNALDLSPLAGRVFDHVLCMGPLYHLLRADQRQLCVGNCLSVLKPGGLLFASFISGFSGIIFGLKNMPACVLMDTPAEVAYRLCVERGESFAGDGFTRANFTQPEDALALMADFPLEKLHLMGCEGILSPNEPHIMAQSDEIYRGWLELAWKVKEQPGLLSYSEHLMYVGRKA